MDPINHHLTLPPQQSLEGKHFPHGGVRDKDFSLPTVIDRLVHEVPTLNGLGGIFATFDKAGSQKPAHSLSDFFSSRRLLLKQVLARKYCGTFQCTSASTMSEVATEIGNP